MENCTCSAFSSLKRRVKEKMSNEIKRAASYIAKECVRRGIIVHRYDAMRTNSVYLKFDYGVAHSLRISDHRGIEKYHYRFNLIKGTPKIITVRYRNKNYSIYYPFKEIYKCLEDILKNRENVIEKYGEEGYFEEVKKIQNRIERLPKEKLYPFWKYGKRVD